MKYNYIYKVWICAVLMLVSVVSEAWAQQAVPRSQQRRERTEIAGSDTLLVVDTQLTDSIRRINRRNIDELESPIDSAELSAQMPEVEMPDEASVKEKKQFIPDPAKAT